MDSEITKYLLSYQIQNATNVVEIVQTNGACGDFSDTGTGKTFSSIAACKQLGLSPIVICPRGVMATWKKVSNIFNIKPFFIVNYETIKYGKYYNEKGKRIKCKYIEFKDEKYTWKNLEKEKIIFIFDEVHKAANFNTFNGLLLISAKQTEKPILILSATIADSAEKFRTFAYILNFIDKETVKNNNIDFEEYMNIINSWIDRKEPMERIYNMIYPSRGTRMRIQSISSFPATQITATPYDIQKKKEIAIEQEYKKIRTLLEQLKEKKRKDKANILVAVLRAHQRIELLKIPLFIDLTNDFIEEGKSVVIFVNYTDTLKTLAKMLHTDCIIWGGQTDDQRQINVQNFQDNVNKVVICNIKCGVGLSLHDLTGSHPRVSLLSPCWSSIDLIQALGRIHRATSKSKSLQRIIFVAGTIEEKIAMKLETKLKDLNTINNLDLDLSNITFEKRYANY